MKILADATLPNVSALFGESFNLTLYHTQNEVADLLATHDILLCRSTLKVTAKLLSNSPIQCVATASSGIDHIDSDYLRKSGIALYDAKGSNARSVADYVVASLAFLSHHGRICGNKAGIIGLGEVGTRVMERLIAAGFDVICFDPLKEKRQNYHYAGSLTELTTCDVLCVHANLHNTEPYPSANLLSAEFLTQLKSGVAIINAARGGIVNEDAVLKTTKPITYCTDVYNQEPAMNTAIVDFATLCTPHIAGHSIEAKMAAVVKISQQLHRHYGLPLPQTIPALAKGPVISPKNSWQECILDLYNPLTDTQILKAAYDKKLAFLTQRQAHQTRHDFSYYDMSQLPQQTRLLLGQKS